MADIQDYISTAEAAEIIGVNDSRIRQMIRTKQLTPVLGKKGQGKYFDRAQIESFANRKRTAGRPKKGGEV